GEFYLWVAKNPEDFFKAYVQKGLDITYNLSFKIKETFTEGDITNQTFQVDFANGYYGNIVINHLPLMAIKKDVLNQDGESIDNGVVQIGEEVTYKLEGWVVPADRGYDITSYIFLDKLQYTHDEYQAFRVEAMVDMTLEDGTVIKAGADLKEFTETSYNSKTGLFELRFKEDFLKQIPRSSEFGADAYVVVKRIASGEVVNEYQLIVNDNEVTSNKVVTTTPEPPKPQEPATPTPTPATPVAPASVLPQTGEMSSVGLLVSGLMSAVAALGLAGRKRKED
ncbi:LPXTG cell wall anchor domain-containing protein, partial [Streptococcus merionis]|uniref:LPXTG cell wall anchor domain-containing protein n=1 Tax=Streptococcus merionis TaxID=400065 RepID=UPI0035146941